MFKKNDTVQHIGNWNGKGEVFITNATVHSCGKKRMVLHRADTGEFLGSNFKPSYESNQTYATVISALPKEEAEAFAIELGQRFIAHEIARYEWILVNNVHESNAYIDAITKNLTAMRAATPSVIWR